MRVCRSTENAGTQDCKSLAALEYWDDRKTCESPRQHWCAGMNGAQDRKSLAALGSWDHRNTCESYWEYWGSGVEEEAESWNTEDHRGHWAAHGAWQLAY